MKAKRGATAAPSQEKISIAASQLAASGDPDAARLVGAVGGRASSERKTEACRKNAAAGGRARRRLSDADLKEIRAAWKKNLKRERGRKTMREVGERFGVSESAISFIVSGSGSYGPQREPDPKPARRKTLKRKAIKGIE